MTSGRILGEFVAERVGSTDYRKLLGTAALIQRDFDALSKLIDEQNQEFLRNRQGRRAAEAGDAQPHHSLHRRPRPVRAGAGHRRAAGRPPAARVSALRRRRGRRLPVARSLAPGALPDADRLPEQTAPLRPATTDEVDQPSPSDYLEKIFQVPFWIEPLGEHGRRSLVRGLLQGNLATTARSDEAVGGVEPLEFADDSEAMVREMFGATRAVRMQTAALSVTPIEFTFLDELAPLLGTTPRSIKRFVNVYQLLCALPLPPDVESPLYEEAVAFILAITDGLPALSAALYEELQDAECWGDRRQRGSDACERGCPPTRLRATTSGRCTIPASSAPTSRGSSNPHGASAGSRSGEECDLDEEPGRRARVAHPAASLHPNVDPHRAGDDPSSGTGTFPPYFEGAPRRVCLQRRHQPRRAFPRQRRRRWDSACVGASGRPGDPECAPRRVGLERRFQP